MSHAAAPGAVAQKEGALAALPKPSLAPVPRLALDVTEACAAVGVSWDTWRAHIEPEVRLVRIGRRKLVPVAELERWLADHAETTLERR
jgi:hypothetical protein